MAEYFKETYRLQTLEVAGSYIIRDEGRPMGIAINLDNGDEYASGGQLCLSREEIGKVYPIMKQFLEELDGK
jgi:hypothetical protein